MITHRDFHYNGANLSDFDLCINELDVSPPEKVTVRKSIPYKSGAYDFSRLYGEPVFADRQLKYTVDLIGDTEPDLSALKTQIINWLMSGEMSRLTDTAYLGWFFVAECVSIQDADDVEKSVFTITFDAEPFMQREWYEGETLWDPFCFETDALQDTSFTVSGSLTIQIYNVSIVKSMATITTSADMTIKFVADSETVQYTLKKGSTSCAIPVGESTVTITGTGTISILFRERML